MKNRCVMLGAVVWLAACTVGWAFDTVKLKAGGTVVGEVTRISPIEVTVQQAAVPKKVAVNEIASIIYDGEPSSLNIARMAANAGRYNDALELLDNPQKINPADLERREMKQDVEFYKALCVAKLALGGTGKLTDAGSMMYKFTEQNASSFHYLEGCQILGDLLVAAGKFSEAEAYYGRLAQAPWPDYKMQAGVAIGRAQLSEKKYDAATKTFDQVLAIEAEGPLADFQRMAATLGKARCLAETGNTKDAYTMVQGVISKADAEYGELLARAYNTLGTIERKAGRNKEAILAFLHVDILYFSFPDAHAEALANLEALWNEVNKAERANKARQILDTRYKNSRWAQQKGG